jgi:hypothetical protein
VLATHPGLGLGGQTTDAKVAAPASSFDAPYRVFQNRDHQGARSGRVAIPARVQEHVRPQDCGRFEGCHREVDHGADRTPRAVRCADRGVVRVFAMAATIRPPAITHDETEVRLWLEGGEEAVHPRGDGFLTLACRGMISMK